eukprot:SM000181S03550  [mRNA]  locus=s181:93120:97190:- [translate_table: standard]
MAAPAAAAAVLPAVQPRTVPARSIRRMKASGQSRAALSPGEGAGFDRVREIIGRANSEDRRTGFGPPPPAGRDRGAGFVNLAGVEDMVAGSWQSPAATLSSLANSGSEAAEGAPISTPSAAPVARAKQEQAALPADVARERAGVLLPSQLTAAQRAIALGMLGVTVLAFGRSSEDLLPADARTVLQVWMRIAWGAHGMLGLAAAYIAQGKHPCCSASPDYIWRPPIKWLAKVANDLTAQGDKSFSGLADNRDALRISGMSGSLSVSLLWNCVT